MPRARSSKHAYLKPKQSTGVRFACFELVAQALTRLLVRRFGLFKAVRLRALNAVALASFDAALVNRADQSQLSKRSARAYQKVSKRRILKG